MAKQYDLPVGFTFNHCGYWITEDGVHKGVDDSNVDRNAVMVDTSCLLYVYKLALRHYLLSRGIIKPSDIDAQNLVPHVVVRKNKHDRFSQYQKIQGRNFIVKEADISIRSDFMLIELDKEKDLHFTLIWSKKIRTKIDLLEAFKYVLRVLNDHPEMIEQYQALNDFGIGEIEHWYETGDQYPYNLQAAKGEIKEEVNIELPERTAAGSILS